MAKVSASNFRDPLLKVMGELSGFQAGVDISFGDTLEPVLKETGFKEDQFGDDSLGRPKTHVWINQAFNKKLRPEGMGEKGSKKGQWTLTEEGVAAAALLAGKGQAAEDEDTPPASTGEETCVKTAPLPSTGGGVSFSLGVQKNTYNPDPYIRGLAINQTSCFGKFYERSDVCASCPLSGACKSATFKNLSQIAANLRNPQNTVSDNPDLDETDLDIEEILAAIESSESSDAENKRAQIIQKVPATTTCSKCGGNIEAGASAYWVRGSGMYHVECWGEP